MSRPIRRGEPPARLPLLRLRQAVSLLALGGLIAGCNTPGTRQDPEDPPLTTPECSGGPYAPAETTKFEAAAAHPKTHADALAAVELAELEPTTAATVFAEVETTLAPVRTFLRTVRDTRAGGAAEAGIALEQMVGAAVTAGKAATTGDEIGVARERIDTALLHGLAAASLTALREASKASYDTGFALSGCPPDNDVASRRALAALASTVDAAEGTLLADILQGALVDGRCELDAALAAAGAESLPDLASADGYSSVLEKVTRIVHRIFALAAAAAAQAAGAEGGSQQNLVRLEGLFGFLAPAMTANATEAAHINAELKEARDAIAAGSTEWATSFDAAGIRERLLRVFPP